MIVSNSTPLIYLSKIGKFFLLKEIFSTVLIPEEVKNEVVDKGKEKNHIDAFEVEKAIQEGWVQVKKINTHVLLIPLGIHKGEAEAISLAHEMKLGVLLDQTHAREAAKLLDLQANGTIFVLLLALKRKFLDYDTYLLAIRDLIDVGFRMSEEVYLEAVRMGKEISH